MRSLATAAALLLTLTAAGCTAGDADVEGDGPPPPEAAAVDLAPGEERPVRLPAGGAAFDRWSADVEVGGAR